MSRSGWHGREDIYGESASSFQPCLHSDFLDASPRIGEPRRKLRQIHAAVVSQVLFLSFSGVRIGLMLFYPFHENSCISHSSYWRVLLRQRWSRYGFVTGRRFVSVLENAAHHLENCSKALYRVPYLRQKSWRLAFIHRVGGNKINRKSKRLHFLNSAKKMRPGVSLKCSPVALFNRHTK